MTEIFLHNFDADGYYTGSALAPTNPVTGKTADINPYAATILPPPQHDPEVERARWVEGAWTVEAVPETPSEPEPEPQEPIQPTYCTPVQGLIALFTVKQITEADLLAAINHIPDPVAQYTAKISFQRASLWERKSQTMQNMAELLGLTPQDLDELFEYAVNVSV